jgi:S-formylglutathione hydrolase
MFGGYNRRYKHTSSSLGCDMTFSIYFPPGADSGKVPVLYYLSGLTCTDENVMNKSGVQRSCAEQGIAFVAPDTSPRGMNVEGESESWVRDGLAPHDPAHLPRSGGQQVAAAADLLWLVAK